MSGIFRKFQPFNDISVDKVPSEAGIYIVYKDGQPFYVGRSRVDIHMRLWRHLHNRGSRKIAVEKKEELSFEYQCMLSVEQAEAQLIQELATHERFNLRRETDPADW